MLQIKIMISKSRSAQHISNLRNQQRISFSDLKSENLLSLIPRRFFVSIYINFAISEDGNREMYFSENDFILTEISQESTPDSGCSASRYCLIEKVTQNVNSNSK